MAWRHIVVENPAKLSLEQGKLVIRQEEEFRIPIEDIDILTLESERISISTALLSYLVDTGVSVYICDEKHMPTGMLLPLEQHSRQLRLLQRQIQLGKPFIKKVWQKIIQSKISNQKKALQIVHGINDKLLENMVNKVNSGDSENLEAQASHRYFPLMFGPLFHRSQEGEFNPPLNYGYAIIRGSIARHLVAFGFIPSLGIHHHSELNPFNLADDFMEPWRPFVDTMVSLHAKETFELKPETKKMLYKLLSCEVDLNGKIYTVSTGIEKMIRSFTAACEIQDEKLLELPKLIELNIHLNE